MAHREQHGNRETRKPKRDKPRDGAQPKTKRWAVSEVVEARDSSKH